jgi:3-phenylpropionate/cinnamic acid dioxygenase small subunit
MSRSLLQDEFDIRRLLAQYCHLCDDGDFGTLLDRFVEDASFILGNRTISGRQELLRWFEKTQ